MNATSLNDRLQAVLAEVWRIHPSWEAPEKFHEAKSDAVNSLRQLIVEAGTLQGHAPSVAARAKATLRLLETPAAPVDPPETVDTPATDNPDAVPEDISIGDPPSPAEQIERVEQTVPAESPLPEPEPAMSPPDAATDPVELQQAIRAAFAGILSDVEKLALASRASVASYAAALTVPPQLPTRPAAAASSAPSSPSAQPGVQDPETLYRRSHLLTEAGRVTAVSLWVDGLSKREIGECFDYHGSSGPACVAAAIAMFLHAHYPTELGVIIGDRGKELAQRALLAIGAEAHSEAETASVARRRGNGQQEFHVNNNVTSSAGASGRSTMNLPALASGRRRRRDLRADAGRVIAAELWVAGHTMDSIGRYFGFSRWCAPAVSRAIAAFVQDYCGPERSNAFGKDRKHLASEALTRFRAAQERAS
jgi:hypothetical protein